MKDAACSGMAPKRERGSRGRVRDPFFPDRGDTVSAAQRICFTCEVRPECRAYSERIGAEYGVWAGAIKER